ncbi:MAG: beta-lactamase family protein [Chloroflexi bacterium]|nr:beta-lactamase family protein [Chloroflexota bacterium]
MTTAASRSHDGPTPGRAIELPDGRLIHGVADEGFGPLVDVFVANFVERHDVGAGCAVYVDGRRVVDLWGGVADSRSGRRWEHDTAAVIFSCTKGVLAICAYLLVQDGRLDLDAPIARYWPPFGGNGKAGITVRDAMAHRAGLPALDPDLTRDDVLAWDPVIRAIESQRPMCPPYAGHLYHAMTYGWLLGEVIHRLGGVMPGRFFRRELGDRLALRTWIGLPDDARDSVAWMEPPLPDDDSDAARESSRLAEDHPVVRRSLSMGGAFEFPAEHGQVTFNDPAIQAAEIPAANGISSADSLARLYAACVSAVDGPAILAPSSIADALRVQSAGRQLSGMPDDGARWGTGFQLSSPPSQPMLGPASFGHAGAGGQLGFADVGRRVGFAYLGNQMGGYGDARARELTQALRAVLGD